MGEDLAVFQVDLEPRASSKAEKLRVSILTFCQFPEPKTA